MALVATIRNDPDRTLNVTPIRSPPPGQTPLEFIGSEF
jgi:hypothetical protein